MNELYISQAFREHQTRSILTAYEPVVKFCSKWVLTPKGQRVFLLKTTSKQPLLKASRMVQN
jgi:hypothetical protein